jgi:hypothetical protein
MDYNRLARERREVAKALVDMGRGGEERNDGGITTNGNGEDNNDNCKPAAKPLVVDNGGKEGVEETCTTLNNVVIKAVADGERDDNNFEGDGNDLGWGEEETTLTDGAMDTGSDAGANDSLMDNMDEIGEETTLTDGTMNTNGDGEDDYNNCKPEAKPLVVGDGGKEGVEETCTALNNVVIKEGDAEAVADGERDDNNFEGDGNNLGQGKEETTLTDGAKDPVSNAGANNSSVKDMDEIGLIFDFEGKKKVCLKEFGSYVKFNNKCLHRGYKRGSVKMHLSAQIFSAPRGNR